MAKDAQILDLKGLVCPMPILKTKQALVKLEGGALLKVLATDPHSEIDFKAYLHKTANELVDYSVNDGVHTFLIKKATF